MAVGGNSSGGGSGGSGGIKAGSAYVELYVKNMLGRQLGAVEKQWQNFGNQIGSIGRKMAIGGVAGLTPLVGAMTTLSDIAKQGAIANAFGLASDQFTGIAGVAKSVGEDTREFTESLVTMGKVISEGFAGKGEVAVDFFNQLGIGADQFINLKADEQFYKIFDAIAKVQDPLTRVRLLMVAFGEDGGKYLLPLLGKSGEELRKMASGFAINATDMKAATEAQKSYTTATTALSRAWQSISVAVAPVVKMIADGMASALNPLREFIQTNREIVVGTVLAVGGLTAMGIGLAVLGPAIKALASSWAILTGAIAVGKAAIAATMAIISAPILALPAALAAAGAAWLAFTDSGQKSVGAVGGMFAETWQTARDGWAAIVAKVSSGDLAGAAAIGAAAFQVEWVRFTNFLDATWAAVVENIQTSLRKLADEFEDFFDIEKDIAYLMGNAVLEQQKGGAFLKQIAGPSPTDIRNMRLQAAKDRLAELMRPQPGGGGIAELAANNPIVNQIRSIGASSQSLGALGGSANVGQFGGGISLTKQIADNTKEQVIQFGNLANWLKMNHELNNGGLVVVPGG